VPRDLLLAAAPVLAILVVLGPYLWPPDHAPSSRWSDLEHQHAPTVELLATALHDDGELPRWDRQSFGGMPTLGDPQAGVYNPVYWLLAVAPSLHAFGIFIVGYAVAGAVGFMLYARALGISMAGASAGAVLFTLGGNLLFRVALLGHTIYEPFFLTPLILWSLHRVAAAPGPRRVAVAAVLLALLVVSLHPQILFYTALVIAVAGLALIARSRPHTRVAAAGALAAAAFLAVALSAVHVLPVVELADEYSRARPEFFDPGAWQAPGLVGAAWMARAVVGASSIEAELEFHLGAVGLVLVVLGIAAWPLGHRHRSVARFHAALAALLLAYAAWLGPVLDGLLSEAVGFSLFRIPLRAAIVLALPVAVLAALGVDALIGAPRSRRRVLACGAAALALALIAAAPSRGAITALVAGLAGMLALERGRAAGALLLVLAVGLDTGRVLAPCVATAPEAEARRPPAGLVLPDDLDRAQRIVQIERDYYEPGIPPLLARERRLETLAGFNSLIPWRFVLYASYAGGFDPFSEAPDGQVPIEGIEEPALFDLFGVSHIFWLKTDGRWEWHRSAGAYPHAYLVPGPIVVPEAGAEQGLAAEAVALERLARLDARRSVLLHGEAAARALGGIGADAGVEMEPFRPVPLDTRSANRIRLAVKTERPAILVLNEPYFRGWRAWRGPTEMPIVRANVLFRALALAPGTHEITMEFAPRSWLIGWWTTVLALVVTAGMMLGAPARRRARTSQEPLHTQRAAAKRDPSASDWVFAFPGLRRMDSARPRATESCDELLGRDTSVVSAKWLDRQGHVC
jgi:hypothetical protein